MRITRRQLRRIIREQVNGKRVTVYRASQHPGLDNTNAADLPGIVRFIEDASDIESVQSVRAGTIVTQYEVEVSGGFGEYQYFNRRQPLEGSGLVGVKQIGDGQWFSFPEGGDWQLLRTGRSIPLDEIVLDDKGFTKRVWWDYNQPAGAQLDYLEKFFGGGAS